MEVVTPKAPNSKLQAPNKLQLPITKISNEFVLVIGIWKLELIWDLEFGAWNFKAIGTEIIPNRSEGHIGERIQ
jgi:hypothetical protein